MLDYAIYYDFGCFPGGVASAAAASLHSAPVGG